MSHEINELFEMAYTINDLSELKDDQKEIQIHNVKLLGHMDVFRHITNIVVSYLDLTNLPSKIWQLIDLLKIYCSHNNLVNLPSEIGQLDNLRKFYCSHNNLVNLPSEIGQLVNLRKFR